ncbi:MAG TPA: hypothetical protein VG737_13440 [Cyclobacteriaceae bacterium]|nr:hypothetical protein [Cyclobacteriaceae bacterium]
MGVTIHFEGRLKSEEDYQAVIDKGMALAKKLNSQVIQLDCASKDLHRVLGEKVFEYHGPVRGIQIQPHEFSDPLVLEFDSENFIQEFCKTQFAGIEVHIEIITFLKSILPHFEGFKVTDEGKLWETNDIENLETKFENFFAAIERAKLENPKLAGPCRLGDRIIDLMSQPD